MKRGWLNRFLRWGPRALFVLVVLFVLFIAEENIRGRITLARYRAELRSKGEKLTLAELNLPKVPIEGNGAPALLAAADALGAATNTHPLMQYRLGSMQFAAPGRVVALSRREQPGNWWSPTRSWEELRTDLVAVSNALEQARSAAREPTLAVDLDYAKGLELQLPHFVKIGPLREWLTAAAFEALHRNDLDAALENIAGIAGLVRLQKDDRLLALQKYRLWTANIGLMVTWEALQSEGWTEQQLAKLQDTWQAAQCLPDFARSIEVERAMNLQGYERDTLKDLQDGIKFMCYCNEELQQSWNYRLDMSLLTARWLIWRATWFQQDRLRALRVWQQNLGGRSRRDQPAVVGSVVGGTRAAMDILRPLAILADVDKLRLRNRDARSL